MQTVIMYYWVDSDLLSCLWDFLSGFLSPQLFELQMWGWDAPITVQLGARRVDQGRGGVGWYIGGADQRATAL